MKIDNIKLRINNFFDNMFDEQSEEKRTIYKDYCFGKVMLLRKICPDLCDTRRIECALELTLESFDLLHRECEEDDIQF